MDKQISLLVKNIDYHTKENEVREYFQKCGYIQDLKFFYSKGNFKGEALITYEKPQDAYTALKKLNNSYFKKRPIYIEISQDHESTSNNQKYAHTHDSYNKHDRSSRDSRYYTDKSHKSSHFSKTELHNQKIWEETNNIMTNGFYKDMDGNENDIREKLLYSYKNTKTIKPGELFDQHFPDKNFETSDIEFEEKKKIFQKIEVTQEGTFEAARRIKFNDHVREVCVLNFASATQPGGGVKNGRTAQEEALSRQSSLYSSLAGQSEMYDFHKANKNPFYSDYMIYSPNVVVFRQEDDRLIQPFRVSVISSAAVNLSEMKIDEKVEEEAYKCMKNRCRKIIQLCIVENNKVIVLGAFGCGVFKNKPENIGRIFKEILVDELYGMHLDKIVFAIKGKPNEVNVNFEVFNHVFLKDK